MSVLLHSFKRWIFSPYITFIKRTNEQPCKLDYALCLASLPLHTIIVKPNAGGSNCHRGVGSAMDSVALQLG